MFLRCIDPFVSGVYAGDPQTLSMRSALPKIARIERYSYNIEWNLFGAIFYGGLARQVELTKERKANPPDPAWPEFEPGNPGSFRNGLSTLPSAIAAALGEHVKLEWRLVELTRAADGLFIARFDTPGGERTARARSVVSTAPAHALRDVLTPVLPGAAVLFDKVRTAIGRTGIYHPPVAAVTVAYPKTAFKDVELPNGFGNLRDLPGFGSLNPRTEGVRTLGTLWSSSLFPGRCPPEWNILLNYIGGSRDVGIAELSDDEIVAEVDKGCRQVLLKPDARRHPRSSASSCGRLPFHSMSSATPTSSKSSRLPRRRCPGFGYAATTARVLPSPTASTLATNTRRWSAATSRDCEVRSAPVTHTLYLKITAGARVHRRNDQRYLLLRSAVARHVTECVCAIPPELHASPAC